MELFLGAFAKLRKAIISFFMFVRLSVWNNSASTGRILKKIDIWSLFEDLSIKLNFRWNLTRITGTLYEDVFAFITVSR